MSDNYSKTTRDIRVSVRSFFLADQSRPDEGKFMWAYRIRIDNLGREPVQLLRRTWHITDARGRTQTVRGAGVTLTSTPAETTRTRLLPLSAMKRFPVPSNATPSGKYSSAAVA